MSEDTDARAEADERDTWFRTEIGARESIDLLSLFMTMFHAIAAERGEMAATVAMFASRRASGPTRYYYFTPDTARLAPKFLRIARAEPCERPTEAVTFEAGDETARRAFEDRRL